jgi:hypothetical protein
MENVPKNSKIMKPAHLVILLVILILGVVNLLAGFGVIGGGSSNSASTGGNWEYRVVTPQEMDTIGFKTVATELGVKEDEEGKMQLPGARVVKNALLQTTLAELKKEGWDIVAITPDSLYIFRKPAA